MIYKDRELKTIKQGKKVMTLKSFLTKTKISVSQFAKNIGINENTLHTYVNGRSEPTVTNAIKIITATHGAVKLTDLQIKKEKK